jgi:uncharacterized protein (DUF1800 family)
MVNPTDPQWAWAAYEPSGDSPWDLQRVGHLYRRAGFGATAAEQQTALRVGPHKAIDQLLAGSPGGEDFERVTEPLAESIGQGNNGAQASAWWLYRMLYSPHPLRERLTLFWHNHFATSNAKVQNTALMLGQYSLMYRNALGSFLTMVQEMSQDPAMMIWLDTRLSKKGMPNENYARELMELFTLGIGNYSERDIREAARAFTGWDIRAERARFRAGQHDDGVKTVLGQKGNWKGADIVRICLEQAAAPLFLVGKLYRFLISETVPAPPELLKPLADQFRASDYQIGPLVRTMLRSNLFFCPAVYRSRVKAPVDFALGIVRALEGHLGTFALAQALQELGQNLFHPPSVKGWDGGPAWLNGHTLLYRQNLALALTSTEDNRFGHRTDPAALARKYHKQSDKDLVGFFLSLFLDDNVPVETRGRLLNYQGQARKQSIPLYWTEADAADHRVRALCHLVLTLPEFQLS